MFANIKLTGVLAVFLLALLLSVAVVCSFATGIVGSPF